MRSANIAMAIGALLLAGACNDDGSGTGDVTPPVSGINNGTVLPPLSGTNVLPLTVNGSLCSSGSYPNMPCVSVTVCEPGTTTCQTIDDILLDTGSYGLRVFSSALGSVSLAPETIDGAQVGTCAAFGDGSTDWGPVEMADVVLGGEPGVTVPIQVIDSTFFSGGNGACGTPDASPSAAGFNGILGVGLLVQDCGATCVDSALNGDYFGCSGSTCTGIAVPLASQVQDPVASLPSDNNGVVVELPSVPTGGVAYANGYVVLGIGTQSDNAPSQVTAYPTDSSGEITTVFSGTQYGSFLDTGSNAYYFTADLPDCGLYESSLLGWYCPSSTTSFSAVNAPLSGAPAGTVDFEIGDMMDLIQSGNGVYVEIGGSMGGALGSLFDWGLPFWLGRNVYVGFEGTTSSLGTGPYVAY